MFYNAAAWTGAIKLITIAKPAKKYVVAVGDKLEQLPGIPHATTGITFFLLSKCFMAP